jgi:hypothetical protein
MKNVINLKVVELAPEFEVDKRTVLSNLIF